MGRKKKPAGAKDIDRLVGSRIKAARGKVTQRELAERLRPYWPDIEPAYISKLEHGQRSLRLDQLALIARVLNINISQLIPPELSVE